MTVMMEGMSCCEAKCCDALRCCGERVEGELSARCCEVAIVGSEHSSVRSRMTEKWVKSEWTQSTVVSMATKKMIATPGLAGLEVAAMSKEVARTSCARAQQPARALLRNRQAPAAIVP